MTGIFESHAHYEDEAFDEDRDGLLKSLPENGIKYVVDVGSSIDTCHKIIELIPKWDYMYGALGIHPEEIRTVTDEDMEWLRKEAAANGKIVAIGEIGLDYHYENYDREKQIRIFCEQLELAKKLKLPVIIHSRNANDDTMEILRRYKPDGVLHCFSGSAETAAEVIKLGMHISFTGVLTFKNAKKALKALERVPVERLMLETDCPYMAPEPWRGQRCNSLMISSIAQKAAEIKGMTAQEIIDITNENAKKFFKIN